jgi:myotubularin-related protein 9
MLLSFAGQLDKLYPFFSRGKGDDKERVFVAESLSSVFERYQCSQEKWRISTCNKNYKLCPSYPEEVIVPAKITDEQLVAVAAFRQQARFPILCYHHPKNKAVILRCGEPLCGPNQKRCREDINLLNSSLQLDKGHIMDTRTKQLALQHTSKGGGFEFPSNYSQWRVEHASLEPVSNMQASYMKLLEVCMDSSLATSSSWFSRLDSTGWLSHVEQLLRVVKRVVHLVNQEDKCVVIHDKTGKDSTLQITSLAILLMDPHSRTINGFLQLIEREWLKAGHPFSLRHGHVSTVPDKDKGPVFLLFLDAVWQIINQYPLSFEFNELLLHMLFVHSYSSSYGNFLYDTPLERHKHNISGRTESLWEYILSQAVFQTLLNPLYNKHKGTLSISTHPVSIRFWQKVYLRSDLNSTLNVVGHAELEKLASTNVDLKTKLSQVRKELYDLQMEAKKFMNEQPS